MFDKKQQFKLLIVEDNAQTQATLRSMFEVQDDMEISVAGDAFVAEGMIDKGYIPDAIVLDLNLPGMSGGEFLREATKNPKLQETKVIPFSSTVDETTNKAYEESKPMVDQYIDARELDKKAGNMVITDIIPKYQGKEGVNIVHPKVIVAVAQVLIRKGFELSPSFQHLLYISQKQVVQLAVKK